jgi:hypothetical protein
LWLSGNLIRQQVDLERFTLVFLFLAGAVSLAYVVGGVSLLTKQFSMMARPPVWILLCALSLGQLLYNKALSSRWRVVLGLNIAGTLVYVFAIERATASYWIGVVAVIALLAWLRWPRLRWPVILMLLVLAGTGILFSSIYDFAGGDAEWTESGGSRLTLISRVVELTWTHNPLTGLGIGLTDQRAP